MEILASAYNAKLIASAMVQMDFSSSLFSISSLSRFNNDVGSQNLGSIMNSREIELLQAYLKEELPKKLGANSSKLSVFILFYLNMEYNALRRGKDKSNNFC